MCKIVYDLKQQRFENFARESWRNGLLYRYKTIFYSVLSKYHILLDMSLINFERYKKHIVFYNMIDGLDCKLSSFRYYNETNSVYYEPQIKHEFTCMMCNIFPTHNRKKTLPR